MKLYHHYKNMPYKFVGLARHSETQEEMVIYETRYENTGGKVWVRPKGMFFENVTINGQEKARFQKIPLEIREFTEITENEIAMIAPIMERAFGQWDPKWFHARFSSVQKFHLAIAMIEGKVAGFKLGYAHDDHEFYSWLGGVLPEYQGIGIASDLMQTQHDWCRQQGYIKIQTKTQNRFREMLLLNIKSGFEVIGTHQSDEGGMKIILEKKLSE